MKFRNVIKIFTSTILVSISSVIIFLFLLESYLRVRLPLAGITPGTYMSDPVRRYKLRPNSSGRTLGIHYKINSYGFRDYDYNLFAKGKGVYRILCVGDSVTFGIGLPLDDTYPKQLEKILKTKYRDKKIEVINCGVPSYNTISEYLFLKYEGYKYDPDLVIIEYVYNDSGYVPTLTHSNYLLDKLKDILRNLYSYEFILERIYRMHNKMIGLSDSSPRNRIENLKYLFSDDYIGWRKNKEAFELLSQFSHVRRTPIIYAIFPILENLNSDYPFYFFHKKVKDATEDKGYTLDLFPYFKGQNAARLWVSPTDSHPNERGNEIVSSAIAEFIILNKIIQ